MLRLFLAAFLVLYVQKAESCTCAMPSGNVYHTAICFQPIAIRANVTVQSTLESAQMNWIVYGLDIISVFRNTTDGPIPTSVVTPRDESMCGVRFQVGTEYLIMGRPDNSGNNTMQTDLCLFNRQWDGIPEAESAKFDEYAKNCTTT